MRILIVNQKEVAELISVTELMPVMEDALKTLARGEAILPQRPSIWLPDKSGQLAMMPTYLPNINALGLKVITYFPGNMNSPYDTHQGGVMLFDTTNGNLLAMIDATGITANRTAAGRPRALPAKHWPATIPRSWPLSAPAPRPAPHSVPKLDQRRMLSVGRSLKRPGASPPDSMGG